MSAILTSPLPALGQSSAPSIADRGEPILVANIFDVMQRNRRTVRPGRWIRRPAPRQQIRQPRPIDPAVQQERQYANSLPPEERMVYDIIQKAKQDVRSQPTADLLGSGVGIPAKGTTQTPADLDREFQNAVREVNGSSQPIVSSGSVASVASVASEAKPGNRILQRILNKRSNETHEQWYSRIDPVIMRTPGAEYRAWKSALSVPDNTAYDAFVKNENQKRREQFSGTMSDMIKYELSCRWVLDPNGYNGDTIRVCGN